MWPSISRSSIHLTPLKRTLDFPWLAHPQCLEDGNKLYGYLGVGLWWRDDHCKQVSVFILSKVFYPLWGYFELLPWDRKSKIVRGFPLSFHDWKSRYFFVFRLGWETLSDDFWGEVPRLLQKWEVPALGAYFCDLLLFFFRALITCLMTYLFWSANLDRPDLEDQYCHRVRATLAYAHEIEDFDDLVDPRHLYDCCLGPEPSKYVLEKIRREEKGCQLPHFS